MGVEDLYQSTLLDHSRRPRRRGPLANANRRAEIANPLCGDVCRVALEVEAGRIKDYAFDGDGCAVSVASASLFGDLVVGATVEAALAAVARLEAVLGGSGADTSLSEWGEAACLAALAPYPARVGCATLAWRAAREAITHGDAREVT